MSKMSNMLYELKDKILGAIMVYLSLFTFFALFFGFIVAANGSNTIPPIDVLESLVSSLILAALMPVAIAIIFFLWAVCCLGSDLMNN